MANTIVSLFRSTQDAQAVVKELKQLSITGNDVEVIEKSAGDVTSRLTSRGVTADAARVYNEGLRRGNTLLSVHVEDNKVDDVLELLNSRGALDLNEQSKQYRASKSDEMYINKDRTQGEYALPVIEEQLAVGKRQVERGGVRVYNRVTEKPVEAQVNLREEHVNVERRPVDRAVTDADLRNAKDGMIEVTTRSEEAVVGKQARVVEEVVVNKDVQERTETVRDTVKRTDVEVEETDATRARGASATTNRDNKR